MFVYRVEATFWTEHRYFPVDSLFIRESTGETRSLRTASRTTFFQHIFVSVVFTITAKMSALDRDREFVSDIMRS